MKKILFKTPAKLNLMLRVIGRRDDGYHDIITLMQMVDLWDEITFEESEKLEVVSSSPDVPAGDRNLVFVAASKIRQLCGIEKGARIVLRKNIPVAAGLGGGSSDAAATLFCLNELWNLSLGMEDLRLLGSEIGSDVPFFFSGPTALGFGRGDVLVRVTSELDYWVLIVDPGIKVSTGWAYEQLALRNDYKHSSGTASSEDEGKWFGPFLAGKELTKLKGHIKIPMTSGVRFRGDRFWILSCNDLEEVVTRRHPFIAHVKNRLVACGATCPLMSGSGSTVFGVFNFRKDAERAYRELTHHGWKVWLVTALRNSPFQSKLPN